MQFDGYEILRELHHSSRSHVYLARDLESGQQVALKTPSVDLRDDAAYLERFLMEEWIARRVDSPHILKACAQTRPRGALYLAMEYVEGQTLAQWMRDNPQPDLERVRDILEQIARGLRALHRLEMLHQDLRPNNIMLDSNGTVILIDFGSVRVAGIAELGDVLEQQHLLGTAQYTAPEYFLGEAGTPQSDQFSLGVIAYQMLSGALPYGTAVARTTTRAAQHKLSYQPMRSEHGGIPTWVDEAVRRAVQPSPHKRYDDISEFIYDLRHPNPQYLRQSRPPLLERNPVAFWQGLCALLLLIVIALAGTHPGIVSGSQADQTPPHPLARTGAEQ
jgi:serine/threonine protein kinase